MFSPVFARRFAALSAPSLPVQPGKLPLFCCPSRHFASLGWRGTAHSQGDLALGSGSALSTVLGYEYMHACTARLAQVGMQQYINILLSSGMRRRRLNRRCKYPCSLVSYFAPFFFFFPSPSLLVITSSKFTTARPYLVQLGRVVSRPPVCST